MPLGEFQEDLHLCESLPMTLNVWRSDQPRADWCREGKMSRTLSVLMLALVLATGTCAAHAHAKLERAEPRAGSSVALAPSEVALWFTERLEPSFSSLTVTNASGQPVNVGNPNVNGTIMRVPLQAIGPGSYQVNWRVLSVDTHKTEGSFSFTVSGQ